MKNIKVSLLLLSTVFALQTFTTNAFFGRTFSKCVAAATATAAAFTPLAYYQYKKNQLFSAAKTGNINTFNQSQMFPSFLRKYFPFILPNYIKAQDSQGNTALHHAVKNKHDLIWGTIMGRSNLRFSEMREAAAKGKTLIPTEQYPSNKLNQTALHIAALNCDPNYSDVVKLIDMAKFITIDKSQRDVYKKTAEDYLRKCPEAAQKQA